MKWSSLSITLLLVIQALVSCSSNDDEKQAGTSSTATGGTTNTSIEPVAGVEAKEKKTDAAVQGLKGKVELLSETIITPGKTKSAVSRNVFKYDKDGNRLELTSYDPKGKMISNLKSTYVDGKITKEETILANGLVDVSSEIKTDAKGNRVEQRDTKTDAVSPLFNFTQLYKYDEKGQMIERTSLRGNGTLMYRYLFKYDDKGNHSIMEKEVDEHYAELREKSDYVSQVWMGIDYARAGARDKALDCFNNAIALKETAITFLLLRHFDFLNIKYLSMALITRKIRQVINF